MDKLLVKLGELIIVCRKNLYYTQDLEKQVDNKDVKRKSYAFSNKICLNSKYIRIK